MKKQILFMLMVVILFSGCASYKFNKGQSPYENGLVVSRNGYAIAEYTLGRDDTVAPDMTLAKERFSRRRDYIEHYYKKMGYIESRFKQFISDPLTFFSDFFVGIFKLPFMAVNDARYERDEQYQRRLDDFERMIDEKESNNIKQIREEMSEYIQNDLNKEEKLKNKTQSTVVSETLIKQEVNENSDNRVEKYEVNKETQELDIVNDTSGKLKAVIKATPIKGNSPLTVDFSCVISKPANAKIISYNWDFNDGTSSDKKSTKNTFYSGNYGSKYFTVTLTIEDSNGNIDAEAVTIEVINL